MATASQIRAMLESHGASDDERFYAVALQMAAAEARRGHDHLAQEIRSLVEEAKLRRTNRKATSSILHVARPQGEAAELLDEIQNDRRIRDLISSPPLRDRINRILEEQRHLTQLKE